MVSLPILDASGKEVGTYEIDTEAIAFLSQKCIGNLNEKTGAVTGERVGTNRAPMLQANQNLEPLLDDLVALPVLDMGNKADAAGVVLIARVIQSLPYRRRTPVHAQIPSSSFMVPCAARSDTVVRLFGRA